MRAKQPKPATPAPFSPYALVEKLSGVHFSGGINWSYAAFDTEDIAKQFEADCNRNGYRTRNRYQLTGGCAQRFPVPTGKWAVQYHHYED